MASDATYVAWLYQSEGWDLPFWGEHSLAAQRQYDIACLVYGSDPETWAHLVAPDLLPVERAARCPAEAAGRAPGAMPSPEAPTTW